jgi:hypothetical protein
MPLFSCSSCKCIENTACCNYWDDVISNKPVLCSECDPEIKKWHGTFEKRSAVGMCVDNKGHLWSQENVESKTFPKHIKITGIIS